MQARRGKFFGRRQPHFFLGDIFKKNEPINIFT
jgi:hypothetical protein